MQFYWNLLELSCPHSIIELRLRSNPTTLQVPCQESAPWARVHVPRCGMAGIWMWRYEGVDGAVLVPPAAAVTEGFPTQSDAESWIGETWRELLDAGVEQVTLLEGDREVYGPMGLRPS